MRRRWAEITIGVLVVVAVAIVLIGHAITTTTRGKPVPAAAVTIPTSDGARLSAYVFPPKGATTKTRAPLLVMPASWSSGSREYVLPAAQLAAAGYEVISYAQRGFRPSTGQVGFADAKTQADVSTVIDWAIAHTGVDKSRIGALGISYGAGVALLGAERDPRIKAVVGMTVWADLGAALDPNRMLNKTALSGLLYSATASGSMDAELTAVREQMQLGLGAAGEAMLNAPVRSAVDNIGALNRNKTAVMLANGFQDSLIIPNQLVSFFNSLTGPKRLELQKGDHGGPEWTGLSGAKNEVWDNARSWLDHYLRGVDNGIDKQQPVQLKDVSTGQWHAYADWKTVGTSSTALSLGAASGASPTGLLGLPGSAPSAPATWSRQIEAGVRTSADSPASQPDVASTDPRFRLPVGVSIAGIKRAAAMVWNSPATTTPLLVSGMPHLHISVTPSAGAYTFFAYLYDVDPAVGGSLVTYIPYTATSATAGQPQTVDVDLAAISWTVPAGHHLALVIDTVDARFASKNVPGSTLTFGSSAADRASLALPVAG